MNAIETLFSGAAGAIGNAAGRLFASLGAKVNGVEDLGIKTNASVSHLLNSVGS